VQTRRFRLGLSGKRGAFRFRTLAEAEHTLGASHQTGWTATVAPILDIFARVDAKALLEVERGRVLARVVREQVGEMGAGAK
jgi:hypothetical protein